MRVYKYKTLQMLRLALRNLLLPTPLYNYILRNETHA